MKPSQFRLKFLTKVKVSSRLMCESDWLQSKHATPAVIGDQLVRHEVMLQRISWCSSTEKAKIDETVSCDTDPKSIEYLMRFQ